MTTTERTVKATSAKPIKIDTYKGVVPEGMIFAAWNTASDGSGRTYKPGQRVTIYGPVKLYPVFVDAVQETEAEEPAETTEEASE